ncbi:MAG: hypothetical protein JJE18_10870 [Eubacteriaceae bacterium]|nr:hypothetical protein [Eubacteriaceae bacterium]
MLIGKIFLEVDGKHGCLVALFTDDGLKVSTAHRVLPVPGSTESISQVYKLVSGTKASCFTTKDKR